METEMNTIVAQEVQEQWTNMSGEKDFVRFR